MVEHFSRFIGLSDLFDLRSVPNNRREPSFKVYNLVQSTLGLKLSWSVPPVIRPRFNTIISYTVFVVVVVVVVFIVVKLGSIVVMHGKIAYRILNKFDASHH